MKSYCLRFNGITRINGAVITPATNQTNLFLAVEMNNAFHFAFCMGHFERVGVREGYAVEWEPFADQEPIAGGVAIFPNGSCCKVWFAFSVVFIPVDVVDALDLNNAVIRPDFSLVGRRRTASQADENYDERDFRDSVHFSFLAVPFTWGRIGICFPPSQVSSLVLEASSQWNEDTPSIQAAFGALFFVSSEFSENPRNVPRTQYRDGALDAGATGQASQFQFKNFIEISLLLHARYASGESYACIP